jgi:hypothetical protein
MITPDNGNDDNHNIIENCGHASPGLTLGMEPSNEARHFDAMQAFRLPLLTEVQQSSKI